MFNKNNQTPRIQILLLVVTGLVLISLACSLGGNTGGDSGEIKTDLGAATPTVEPAQVVEEQVDKVFTPTPEPTAVPAPTETAASALTAQEAYDLALAEAQAWQADAVLSELGTSTLGPLDVEGKSEGWAAKFWSPSAKEMNSMIFMNGTLNATALPLPSGARIVPAMDSVILDTKSIYDTAAAAGGQAYLDAGYDAMASLVTYPMDENVPTWYVNYMGPTVGFSVIIDARSGDVIQAIALEEPVGGTGEAETNAAMATGGDVDFTDPASVLQAVFDAAQSGDFAALQNLCDPLGENDSDTQMICDLATDNTERASFVEFFEKAQINGDAQISLDGSEAEVPFLFGPDGQEEETMKLINRDGNWYLSSF
jgi:hypothetical protein